MHAQSLKSGQKHSWGNICQKSEYGGSCSPPFKFFGFSSAAFLHIKLMALNFIKKVIY